ncbi:MAG: hypothetical protein P8J87_10675, partial [Verrucomicrobiales bacterium]|nr:hypothetical protein [Verrucomicrobiales bacterium]
MKTIPLSGRELSAIVVLAALVVLGTASGQDPNGNDGGGNLLLPWPGSDVSMDSRNVTEEGEGRHEIVVTYSNATGVQRESLGDGDLLVVSRNGYLQEAALVSVVELPIEVDPWGIVDPATGEPMVDPNVDLGLVIDPNIIFPPRWNSIVATYAVTPGSGERWTEADNGGYAVLLQRGEVLWEGGAAVPAQLLGYFDVRIGVDPPDPILPVRAMVEIEALPTPGAPGGNTLDAYFANVKVWYSGREVRVDWDGVVREGNTFIGRVGATAVPGVDGGGIIGQPDVLEEYGHVFDLGLLGRGDYRFL